MIRMEVERPEGFGFHDVHPVDKLLHFICNQLDLCDVRNIALGISSKLPDNEIINSLVAKDALEDDSVKARFFTKLLHTYGPESFMALLEQCINDVNFIHHGTSFIEVVQKYKNIYETCKEDLRKHGIEMDAVFVGRRKETKELSEILFKGSNVNEAVRGLCIYGMFGQGKSSLARHICLQDMKYDIRNIDLRNHKSTKDVVMKILARLNSAVIQSDQAERLLLDQIMDIKTHTVLIFDSAEDPLKADTMNFMTLFEQIFALKNQMVKVIITCQLDVIEYAKINNINIGNLGERLICRELSKMSPTESHLMIKEMLKTELKKRTINFTEREYEAIALNCNNHPYVIKTVAKFIGSEVEKLGHKKEHVLKALKDVAKKCQSDDDYISSNINMIFNSLDRDQQEMLIKISVFFVPFDIVAAEYVTQTSRVLLGAELRKLKDRGLLEQTHFGDQLDDSRYALHTLTFNYINKVCPQKFNDIRNEAKKNLINYQAEFLRQMGKMVHQDPLKFSEKMAEFKPSLARYIEEANDEAISDLGESNMSNFRNQSQSLCVLEWYFSPEKRADFFLKQAKIAKTKGRTINHCEMLLWHVDQYFKGDLFRRDVVSKVLKKVDEMLKTEEARKPNTIPVQLSRAHYNYEKGRYMGYTGQDVDALNLGKEAVKVHKKILDNSVFLARDLNFIGHIHYKLKQYEKATKYHQKAYLVMQKIAKRHHSEQSDHIDNILILMNIGTNYQMIGYRHADRFDELDNHRDELDSNRASEKDRERKERDKYYNEAMKYYTYSQELSRRLHLQHSPDYALLLNNIAVLSAEMDEPAQALRTAEEAEQLQRFCCDPRQLMHSKYLMATYHRDIAFKARNGSEDKYQEHLNKSLELFNSATDLTTNDRALLPGDVFVEKLLRDHPALLMKLGRSQEAEMVRQKIQRAINNMLNSFGSRPANLAEPVNTQQKPEQSKMEMSVSSVKTQPNDDSVEKQADDLSHFQIDSDEEKKKNLLLKSPPKPPEIVVSDVEMVEPEQPAETPGLSTGTPIFSCVVTGDDDDDDAGKIEKSGNVPNISVTAADEFDSENTTQQDGATLGSNLLRPSIFITSPSSHGSVSPAPSISTAPSEISLKGDKDSFLDEHFADSPCPASNESSCSDVTENLKVSNERHEAWKEKTDDIMTWIDKANEETDLPFGRYTDKAENMKREPSPSLLNVKRSFHPLPPTKSEGDDSRHSDLSDDYIPVVKKKKEDLDV